MFRRARSAPPRHCYSEQPTCGDVEYIKMRYDVNQCQRVHASIVHAEWEEIWKAAIRKFVAPQFLLYCNGAAEEFRAVLEELSMIYITQLLDEQTLSKRALAERHASVLNRSSLQSKFETNGTPRAEKANPFLTVMRLVDLEVVVPDDGEVVSATWSPPCNIYGTDRICSVSFDKNKQTIDWPASPLTPRELLLLAAFAECLKQPKASRSCTTVHAIAYDVGFDVGPEFTANFFQLLGSVQNEFLKRIWQSSSFHRTTHKLYVSSCVATDAHVFIGIQPKILPFLVPIPKPYTAFIIDIIMAKLQGTSVPFEIERYHRMFKPFPDPQQTYAIWSKFDLPTPTRTMLLRGCDDVQDLKSKGLLKFKDTKKK
jgi:hypothetical protein